MAESSMDANTRELNKLVAKAIPRSWLKEKEKNLQMALLDRVEVKRLLGLAMDSTGRLNPILDWGICERFINMRSIFYRWQVFVMRKVIQNFISDFWKTSWGYQVKAELRGYINPRSPTITILGPRAMRRRMTQILRSYLSIPGLILNYNVFLRISLSEIKSSSL